MISKIILPEDSLALFVKSILVYEDDKQEETLLPFYADGYPGLLFFESENGMSVNPHQKKMPELYLYGQTLKSIELVMKGPYKIIVYQLYPFVLRSFFDVNPMNLNDGCFDLDVEHYKTLNQLKQTDKLDTRIEIINTFLLKLFQIKQETLDFSVRTALYLIAESKGQISISELSEKIHLTDRTLERRFLKEVGISPKQFSKIIKFHNSYEELIGNEHNKISDIVYNNGFADQSHFIRVFKAYTGSTPKKLNLK